MNSPLHKIVYYIRSDLLPLNTKIHYLNNKIFELIIGFFNYVIIFYLTLMHFSLLIQKIYYVQSIFTKFCIKTLSMILKILGLIYVLE